MKKSVILVIGGIILALGLAAIIYETENTPPAKPGSQTQNNDPAAPGQGETEIEALPAGEEESHQGRSGIGEVCDLSAYNLDCGIVKYLEENIAWTTQKKSVDFCAYELMNPSADENPLYLYATCEEFYVADNGKIYEASGTMVPVKLTKSGSAYTSWMPRDGSMNDEDMKANFPADYQPQNRKIGYEYLETVVRQRAEAYFNASFDYQVEKTLDQSCTQDIECTTPGEYLMMSRCRFISLCIDAKCTVVCPNPYNPPAG